MTPRAGTRVVVVEAGLAGLATAVAAAERGHAVTVLEKGDQAGGAAAFSGGQVWVAANHVERAGGIEDNLADAERYVRAIGASHPELVDDAALHQWLSTAPFVGGRLQQRVLPQPGDHAGPPPAAQAGWPPRRPSCHIAGSPGPAR